MTQEEKAKAYDEALERARKLYNDAKANEYISDIDDYEYIFPSLAESEDERIKKIITDSVFYQYGAGVEYKDVLDYLDKLEKQKEQKPVEKPSMLEQLREHLANTPKEQLDAEFEELKEFTIPKPAECLDKDKIYVIMKNQQPTEWSEKDSLHLANAVLSAEKEWGNESCTAKWLKSLPERFNLQPKREWSEEDEEKLKAICTYLQDYPRLAKINDVKRFNEYCDWLKSLPLNLKKKNEDVAKLCSNEWSEEDETALGDLMWCIEQARKSAKDENDMGNIWFAENWVKNRLKSLRPQYHGDVTMTEAFKMGLEAGKASSWQPSEEDLTMLEHIIGQYETGNKNSKVMGYLPRIEELDFLKKVFAIWKS